jgi:YfiH family protein
VVDLPWTWLHQVHGSRVVVVSAPGEWAGDEADAAVTDVPGAALSVQTADCAPVVLRADGVAGVAHAGWRGLVDGVVGAAVGAMRDLGARDITAAVGPSIGPECYEFGDDLLDEVAGALGPRVRAATATGRPALDLRAAVVAALAAAGVDDVDVDPTCTACGRLDGEPLFSHRARGERERHATVAWLP